MVLDAEQSRDVQSTQPKIIVYTKPDCADCFNAKRYLANRSIPFETRDISEEAVVDELISLVGEGEFATPIIAAGEQIFAGFAANREHLDRVLGQLGW